MVQEAVPPAAFARFKEAAALATDAGQGLLADFFRVVAQRPSALPGGLEEVAIHERDDLEANLLGAHGFAFADVGAASEQVVVGLRNHGDGALLPLGLALR